MTMPETNGDDAGTNGDDAGTNGDDAGTSSDDAGTTDSDGLTLVWSDEFSVDGPPNPQFWNYEYGFERNEEDQWYQSSNVFCENGNLVIEAREETFPNPWYDPNYSGNPVHAWKYTRPKVYYTSGSINTRGKYSFQYGRIQVRAKIVAQEGLWPAIWTLGDIGEWPSCGEIDLMEHYWAGWFPPARRSCLHANFIWGTATRWSSQSDAAHIPIADLGTTPDIWDNSFHIWRMDWEHGTIAIYMDDKLMNEIDTELTMNPVPDWGPPSGNGFRQAHFILLNLAIGGIAGGNPVAATYPSRYFVDYVRVYQ